MEWHSYNIVKYLLPVVPVAIILFSFLKTIFRKAEPVKDSNPADITPPVEEKPSPVPDPEVDQGSIGAGVKLLKAGELDKAENTFLLVLDTATEQSDLSLKCEARFYLAKVNYEMGDLTLACEHWQIARDLYAEAGDEVRIKEIDKYMKENGCPTEWVLNAF